MPTFAAVIEKRLRTAGAIAQLVEQRTENPCVPGSIPGGTTLKRIKGNEILISKRNRDFFCVQEEDSYQRACVGLVKSQEGMKQALVGSEAEQ